MENDHYQHLIHSAPFGYAYHQIKVDEHGRPIDYNFLEINPAFERLTGLKRDEILGRWVTEVLPDIAQDPFDWISFYGDIALNGGETTFEQYSEVLQRWYQVQAYAPEPGYFATTFTDISSTKEAEIKIKESEASKRVLLDNITVQVWYLTDEQTYGAVNRAHAEFNGMSAKAMSFKNMYQIFPANVVAICRRSNNAVFSTGQTVCSEEWAPNAAGELRLLSITKIPKLDDQGHVEYVVCSAEDITERKHAEDSLRESENKFRLITENTSDGIVAFDAKNQIRYLSPSYLEQLGYDSPDQFRQQYPNIFDAVHPDERDEIITRLEQALDNQEAGCTITYRARHKNGHYIWREDHVQYEYSVEGEYRGAYVVCRNITERKSAEDALRESEQRFRTILEAVESVAVQGYDDQRRVFFWNKASEQLYGYSYEEALGQKLEDLIIPEPMRAEVVQLITNWAENDIPIPTAELRLLRKDGSLVPVYSSHVMQTNNDGRKEMYCIDIDLSEIKRIQTHLIKAKEEAEAANQAKSEFLANMSHEIRTPLNGVIGFTDLLQNTPLNPIQQQYVDHAGTSAQALLGIINDILDLSKIEAGKMELEWLESDLIGVVEDAADIIQYQASQKGLELLLHIDPAMPPLIQIDAVRLKQVLVNLLSNAVKFTHHGEIALRVGFDPTGNNQGLFTFSVRDTGIGITPEQQKRLFKAFSQADSSTTRKFGGTGLGLVISRLLVEKMGGTLNMESIAGQGTCFSFNLPLHYNPHERPLRPQWQNLERVLVVDDNARNRLILEHILQHWGLQVQSCASGPAALELLRRDSRFDAMLVDYHMPEMDGLETIERWQQSGPPSIAPRVLLLHSSAEDSIIHERCHALGIEHTLVKPIRQQHLLAALQNLPQRTEVSLTAGTGATTSTTAEREDGPCILIAEDVPMNMLLVTTLLKRIYPNVRVIQARNGHEALLMVQECRPTVILMDIQMPEMDGLEATQHLRRVEAAQLTATPIIALTAGAVQSEREKCLAAGMDGFLTKPIKKNELQEALAPYLKVHHPA